MSDKTIMPPSLEQIVGSPANKAVMGSRLALPEAPYVDAYNQTVQENLGDRFERVVWVTSHALQVTEPQNPEFRPAYGNEGIVNFQASVKGRYSVTLAIAEIVLINALLEQNRPLNIRDIADLADRRGLDGRPNIHQQLRNLRMHGQLIETPQRGYYRLAPTITLHAAKELVVTGFHWPEFGLPAEQRDHADSFKVVVLGALSLKGLASAQPASEPAKAEPSNNDGVANLPKASLSVDAAAEVDSKSFGEHPATRAEVRRLLAASGHMASAVLRRQAPPHINRESPITKISRETPELPSLADIGELPDQITPLQRRLLECLLENATDTDRLAKKLQSNGFKQVRVKQGKKYVMEIVDDVMVEEAIDELNDLFAAGKSPLRVIYHHARKGQEAKRLSGKKIARLTGL